MKRFLTSVSLQHEPKASDVITLVKKTVFARVSYEILFHTRSEIKMLYVYTPRQNFNTIKISVFRDITKT